MLPPGQRLANGPDTSLSPSAAAPPAPVTAPTTTAEASREASTTGDRAGNRQWHQAVVAGVRITAPLSEDG